MAKRSKLSITGTEGERELVYSFNEKPIAIIPLNADEDVMNAAWYLVSAFNKVQPEE